MDLVAGRPSRELVFPKMAHWINAPSGVAARISAGGKDYVKQ
jgi:hypothetical protein